MFFSLTDRVLQAACEVQNSGIHMLWLCRKLSLPPKRKHGHRSLQSTALECSYETKPNKPGLFTTASSCTGHPIVKMLLCCYQQVFVPKQTLQTTMDMQIPKCPNCYPCYFFPQSTLTDTLSFTKAYFLCCKTTFFIILTSVNALELRLTFARKKKETRYIEANGLDRCTLGKKLSGWPGPKRGSEWS